MQDQHEDVVTEYKEQILDLSEQKSLLFLSLKEASVDGIMADHVFDEMPHEHVQRVVAACFYGLKPKGSMAFVVFDGVETLQTQGGTLADQPKTIYPFTEKSICSLIEQTGFRIMKVGKRTDGKKLLPEMLILANRIR